MIEFYKMHGIGNDYVYIDCFFQKIEKPSIFALKMSDRHFGIGGDGIVLILPSDIADCKMDMYNADGSQGKMCGNAIRCVGKYMYDIKEIPKTELTVETLSGIKHLKLHVDEGEVKSVTVDMGEPVFDPSEIPVNISEKFPVVLRETKTGDSCYKMTFVSMGNPHAVIFLDEITNYNLEKLGESMENNPIFPEGINTEIVKINDLENIEMRVWERGSNETLACGTGACASVVAGVLAGKISNKVKVKLLGGMLDILWDENSNHVFMTGPAEVVFKGFWLAK